MVFNPKLSQSVVSWCLESALCLVLGAVDKIGEKIDQKQLKQYFYDESTDYNVSRAKINKTLYDLKRRNYIEIDSGDSVKLTNKAKIKIIDKISEHSDKDGKYRLVSFDIPETKRSNRNNFRRAIKRMHFKQIQKSLWVTDRNVGEMVDIAAKEYGVSDYIAYFVADRSNIDKFIAKKIKDQS